MMQIRPMLAAQKYRDAGDLWGPTHEEIVQDRLDNGPLVMQPKIDGMRCVLHNSYALSRSFKPLGNMALQAFAGEALHLSGLDGEVFSGHDYSGESFRKSMSGVRASTGDKNLTIVYFDHIGYPHLPWEYRFAEAQRQAGADKQIIQGPAYSVKLVPCPSKTVATLDDIYEYEASLLTDGWEGGIIRDPLKPYKYGRSTALGMELVKVKRRNTVDAQVIGYEPRYENQNEAKKSELGYTTRSAHQENLVQLEMLGALRIRLLDSGIEQKCGVFRGLTHDDLRTLWQERETLAGRYCEVSVDSASGGYDSSRCPVWLRWREASEF